MCTNLHGAPGADEYQGRVPELATAMHWEFKIISCFCFSELFAGLTLDFQEDAAAHTVIITCQ